MQALGSRKGGVLTLAVVIVAAVVAAAFLAVQLSERARVAEASPEPGSAVSSVRPTIAFGVGGAERLGDLRVRVDGRDATALIRTAADGRLTLRPERLAEGTHRVEVSFSGASVFSRSVSRTWTFDVDTVRPVLALRTPAPGAVSNRRRVRFAGRTDPHGVVRVAWEGGAARGRAGADGRFAVRARLPEGRTEATVTVADRAGNARRRVRQVGVDTTAPLLQVSAPAAGETLTETDEPLVYGRVSGEAPATLVFGADVNGREVTRVRGDRADLPVTQGTADAAASTGTGLQLDEDRFALAVGTLPQGRNRIAVWTRDRAGNVTRRTRVVVVDSSEEFGSADLVRGARGADVTALQERLRASGRLKGRASGVLDARTARAVAAYQRRFRLKRTGVVDAATRRALVGRIVVSLGQRKLRLIRDGRVARTYRVAIGQPAYPTPTGTFTITTMQTDPTWSPPDSPWAAGLGPIPPGPGNPLGTRWIGTSSPAIGIHGTYADSSIGTAASHGCIRMHIPEVEELYDEVSIGMEVSFRP